MIPSWTSPTGERQAGGEEVGRRGLGQRPSRARDSVPAAGGSGLFAVLVGVGACAEFVGDGAAFDGDDGIEAA
jgi:hypothetical protein